MPISVYRITHYKNIDFILKNGIHCRNSVIQDPNFISIGNPSIIDRRSRINVPITPFGVLNDYIPFYFGKHSPMLLQIHTEQAGGTVCSQKDIIYIVSSESVIIQNNIQFVFTDGHAVDRLTRNFFNDINDLNKLDWQIINKKYWAKEVEDPDRQRRMQSEFLVFKNMPINCILGIGVYNDKMKTKVDGILKSNNCSHIKCKVKREWYY